MEITTPINNEMRAEIYKAKSIMKNKYIFQVFNYVQIQLDKL